MLLTSAQASLAVSSGVVFLFTLALFLSGYALQQRTLRELLAAIKPAAAPSPQIFLPDRFKQSTTELPDGTVIVVDDDVNDNGQTARQRQRQQQQQQQRPAIQVRLTRPDDDTSADRGFRVQGKRQTRREHDAEDDGERGKERPSSSEGEGEGGSTAAKKPISRAERRRRIKQDLMRAAESEKEEKGSRYVRRRLW
ncbi:hypothetical protein VTK26DRAFT_8377 [Humicola hyalothermophila]